MLSIYAAKSGKKDGKKLVKNPSDSHDYSVSEPYDGYGYPTSAPYYENDSTLHVSIDSEDEALRPRHVLPPVESMHTRSGGSTLRTGSNLGNGRVTPGNGRVTPGSQAGQHLSVNPGYNNEHHGQGGQVAASPGGTTDNEGQDDRYVYHGRFNGPHITREIYAEPVLLKAHSNGYLQNKDPQIFNVMQRVMTPYLERALGNELSAYQMEIVYTPEEVADGQTTFVTNVEVSVVLKVTSNSVHELKQTNSETASLWLRDFFKGGELYQFLGECRQSDCDITELVFRSDEFRHPVFDGPVISEVNQQAPPKLTVTSPSNDSDKSRVGIFAALGAGFVVLAAVFAVSFEQRYRQNVLRRLRLEAFSDSESRSSSITPPDFQGRRRRTFSGSFRRHPAGGIKPAAIQKKPAFSEDLRASKSPPGEIPKSIGAPSIRSVNSNQRFDDRSYSVAGDFNIPSEYSVKASPFTDYHRQSPSRRNGHEEEFGMPEAYSITSSGFGTPIKNYQKAKSATSSRMHNGRSTGKPLGLESPAQSTITNSPPERDVYVNDSPTLKMVDSYLDKSPDAPGLVAATPMSNHVNDEWSIDSYSTLSIEKPDVPYRGWSKNKKATQQKKQTKNDLKMPKLT